LSRAQSNAPFSHFFADRHDIQENETMKLT